MIGNVRQYGYKDSESLREGDIIERNGELFRLTTGPYAKHDAPELVVFGATNQHGGIQAVTIERKVDVPVYFDSEG